MARLDTWNPSEGGLRDEEVESVVDAIAPAPLEVQRRMDDLVNAKRYVEQEEKSQQGTCNFCGHLTAREFCSSGCETKAAFATIGKSLKFHE